jgi:hypothetical protein
MYFLRISCSKNVSLQKIFITHLDTQVETHKDLQVTVKLCSILTKTWMNWHTLFKLHYIKFHENPFTGSRAVSCVQKPGHNKNTSHQTSAGWPKKLGPIPCICDLLHNVQMAIGTIEQPIQWIGRGCSLPVKRQGREAVSPLPPKSSWRVVKLVKNRYNPSDSARIQRHQTRCVVSTLLTSYIID